MEFNSFDYAMSSGTFRYLKSFGVATVIATTNSGITLQITGRLKMSVDTAALGISPVSGEKLSIPNVYSII